MTLSARRLSLTTRRARAVVCLNPKRSWRYLTTAGRLLPFVALVLLGVACSAVKPEGVAPRVAFLGMVPIELGLLEQTFQVRLRIENPNDFPLTLKGLDYELFVNGEQLLTGVAPVSAEIGPFETVMVQLPGRGSILEWINSQDTWDGDSVRYRITGYAHLSGGAGRVPFEREGEIRLGKVAGTPI